MRRWALIYGYGVVAFRDPCAIRPLCFGVRETTEGKEYMVASESVALDALGFELVRDLQPGEAIVFTLCGEVHSRQCFGEPRYAPCIFEYVYPRAPRLDHRRRVGVQGAAAHGGGARGEDRPRVARPRHRRRDPLPETSRTACLPLAYDLGVKYREGFIKNRYVARTFIMPGQTQRARSVRRKLNAIGLEFEGKNVLLVDDSIVRGTTSRQIIQQARDAGARRVYFASAAPPVRYQNVYGIDMPATGELVAFNRSEDDVAGLSARIGSSTSRSTASWEAVQRGNSRLREFDTSCFTGEYVTGGVSSSYLEQIAEHRADSAKSARAADLGAGVSRARGKFAMNEFDASGLGFDTLSVRAGQARTGEQEHNDPIFLTSSFVFANAREAAARFSGEAPGNVYSRFTNPTVRAFEHRLAVLEGGARCIATASGMSAILMTSMTLLRAGEHVVAANGLFGTTTSLLANVFARFGIETTFVDVTDMQAWSDAIRPQTKMLFAESPTNPLGEVADIAALGTLARAHGAVLVIDNGLCTRRSRAPSSSAPTSWCTPLPSTSTGRAAASAARWS